MESKLIWHYLHSDRPIHCRRTLDQYGYPSLRNTAVRDADQILYKRTKVDKDAAPVKDSTKNKWHSHRSSADRSVRLASDDGNAKVLMVDQLWLWILNNGDCHTVMLSAVHHLLAYAAYAISDPEHHLSAWLILCYRDRNHVRRGQRKGD